VAPVPTVDAAIGLRDALAEAAPGTRVTARFDIGNGGTALATGVSVDITLPANASFSSASSSQGGCTDGAGVVSCTIGDVPAGSNRIVTIEMVATEVGAADLLATVSAAADTDPANDSLVTEFRVKPDAQAGGGTPTPAAGPAPSGAGGGGASEPVWLALLGLLALFRMAAGAVHGRAPAVRARLRRPY
jgi:uncharacterized repeat protein (TIGR01451 family)